MRSSSLRIARFASSNIKISPYVNMNPHVEPSPPPPDSFLAALSSLLLPVDGWGSFRPGSRPAAVTAVLYRRDGVWQVPFVARRADPPTHPCHGGPPRGGPESRWRALDPAARLGAEE